MTTESDRRSTHDQEMAALTETCRKMIAAGADREEMLANLYHACAVTSAPWPPNPLDAIQVVRAIYGVGLHDALAIVREHPSWSEQAGHILS
jgi:hypothetical protein